MRGVALLPLTGVGIAAGLAFHRIFSWPDLLPVVLPAAIVPAAVAWLMSRWAPLWGSLLVQVVLWALAVTVLFQGIAPVEALVHGLRDGWRIVLGTVPPLPGRPDLLLLPLTCTWLAATAAAETALRTRRALPAILPGLLVLAVATVLSAGAPTDWTPVAFVICAGLTVLTRSEQSLRLGRLVSATGLLIVAVVAAMLVVPRLSLPDPADPRGPAAAAPQHRRQAISPLDQIAPWLLRPAEDLFTVESAQARLWRLAVFDTFNGVTWSHSGLSQPTGGRVPGATGTFEHRVTILDLPGIWLPAADRPTEVDGLPIEVEPGSGMLFSVQPLRPGLRYDVVSRVSEPDVSQLTIAPAAQDAAAKVALALPATDATGQAIAALEDLRRQAQEATAGASHPFQQAVMLQSRLRENLAYDVAATPGHSYRAMQFFLNTTRRGTSEHFATTFAVMARSLGLPSRVVVGFRPGLHTGGLWHVRSGDVLAWPEVDFAGVGWVPFHPTPDTAGSSGAGGVSVPVGVSPARQALEQQVLAQAHAPAPAVAKPAAIPPSTVDRIRWELFAGVAGLCYIVAVLATPPWRRRRLRRATAERQVMAAWRLVQRRLRPLLPGDTAALTNVELAHAATAILGEEGRKPLTALAELTDRAIFAERDLPPTATAQIWAHCRQVERLSARRTPLPRKLIRYLNPRRFGD